MVPDLEPMLADRGLPSGDLGCWAVEPKLDGWRVTVLADPGLPGGVVVRTRRGHAITASVPGIEALGRIGRRLVLDGELVAGAGRASEFYSLMPRIGRRSIGATSPVSFWAFDVLWLDGELLVGRSYADRRAVLEELPLGGACRVVPRFPGADARDLLAACAEHDVEGIVLKRLASGYRPGERSRHWRKVKVPSWAALHAQRRHPR
jgi:bifunctional non-homologous end joining protein LigD